MRRHDWILALGVGLLIGCTSPPTRDASAPGASPIARVTLLVDT